MKIKLLKKLRKKYLIQERNGKYRVFDKQECLGMVHNKTNWTSLKNALKIKRDWILRDLRLMDRPKKSIKNI